MTGKTLVSALKLPAPVTDVKMTRERGGPRRDDRSPRAGHDLPVAATKLRGALGLRSTWFDVGILSLAPPSPSVPVVYGSTVSLSGFVRGVTGVSFEQRPSATPWQTVAPVTPAADGSVKLTATPTITTDYRLATSAAAAGAVRIRVDAARHDHVRRRRDQVQGTRAAAARRTRPCRCRCRTPTSRGRSPPGHRQRRRHVRRPGAASAGSTYRVVVTPGARIRAGDDGAADRGPLMRRVLPALVVAALVAAAPAAAFTPTDPLAPKQWYLTEDHAFDAWADAADDARAGASVAIVDSGIDGSLPDFAGRIADAKSFVGGNPLVDTEGHGTFVAGEIAANLDTQGIVGIAYTSQLLIAKVVKPDGTIPLAGGGGGDPLGRRPGRARDQPQPRRRARPAAPQPRHVLAARGERGRVRVREGRGARRGGRQRRRGVLAAVAVRELSGRAAARDRRQRADALGNVPDFSNRDAIYNDISAPGSGIFSTFPCAITALRPTCVDQGYSDCGPDEYRNPEGTSFAAPQVSAAAAVLFAVEPDADEQPGRDAARAHAPTT